MSVTPTTGGPPGEWDIFNGLAKFIGSIIIAATPTYANKKMNRGPKKFTIVNGRKKPIHVKLEISFKNPLTTVVVNGGPRKVSRSASEAKVYGAATDGEVSKAEDVSGADTEEEEVSKAEDVSGADTEEEVSKAEDVSGADTEEEV